MSSDECKTVITLLLALQVSGEGQLTLDPKGVPIGHGTQVAFVGATLPRDIENILKDVVPVSIALQ